VCVTPVAGGCGGAPERDQQVQRKLPVEPFFLLEPGPPGDVHLSISLLFPHHTRVRKRTHKSTRCCCCSLSKRLHARMLSLHTHVRTHLRSHTHASTRTYSCHCWSSARSIPRAHPFPSLRCRCVSNFFHSPAAICDSNIAPLKCTALSLSFPLSLPIPGPSRGGAQDRGCCCTWAIQSQAWPG
jgi:hypothetical protein